MHPLHPPSRLLHLAAVLALVSAYFTPLWQIQLWAPQYPEGLNMKIWIDHLSGAFDIINGLNHYIGMAMIREEMFPELGFMIYVLAAFIVLGLLAALFGTRRWLWAYVIVLGIGAMAGLADFYRWGYEYGHNLDPNAAIQVPGMSYQPPIIGYKALLNFVAYSGPDIGGWIMIASGALSTAALAWEQFIRSRRPSVRHATLAPLAAPLVLLAAILPACERGPEPMRYGKDECVSCRMVISDQRFGCQIVTSKGRVFKFDDLCCMDDYLKQGDLSARDVLQRYVGDFNRPNHFIPAGEAFYLRRSVSSPMSSNTPAFATAGERDAVKAQLGKGDAASWQDLATSD